jgi:hypothetical protein
MLLTASPARAEFPVALSAWLGAGPGSGHQQEVGESGRFGVWGIDAAWRYAPGRALVVTYEAAGLGGLKYITDSPYLSRLEHRAITVGLELSSPPRTWASVFFRTSAGLGQVATDGSRGMPLPGTLDAVPIGALTEYGFALSGAAGVRLIPPPGPLGFTIALRAAHIGAHDSSSGSLGVTVGMTFDPLARRTP